MPTEPQTEELTHMHCRLSDGTARRTHAAAKLLGVSPSECVEEALVDWLQARGIPQTANRPTDG